ncbi:MAG: hypothetical protein WCT45_00675 [Candidatus Paceibacterota bacterium]|jgi:D-hexose-6-phosphate mutarotase
MPAIVNDHNVIEFSEVGGTILSWEHRGIKILFPQTFVRRGGEMRPRGGMPVCWPNFGTVDPAFGLPQHGVLRKREADEIAPNGVVFRGTDLLGPMHNVLSEVRILIEPKQTGFVYTLAARLLEPSPKEVFVNAGFHPYFRTPTGDALAGTWVGGTKLYYQSQQGPIWEDVDRGLDVHPKGVGTVKMRLGGVWDFAMEKRVVFWRDSRDYLCAEPILGMPGMYGTPDCPKLTEKGLVMTCAFSVSLD